MGMFDTNHIQSQPYQGRRYAIRSKPFACLLDDHELGDFVAFDRSPLQWVVILLEDGCFRDAYIPDSEADTKQAAAVMVNFWQAPERQAKAFKRHAEAHFMALTRQQHALDRLATRLRDFAEREQRIVEGKTPEPEPHWALLRHDFDQEGWDWAVARLLLELEGYRERVPARYAVADQMGKSRKANR